MARKFLVSLDLTQNELLNARIQNLGSAPTSPAPVEGQIYYNTGDKTLYFYNNTAWIPTSGSAEVIQDTVATMITEGTGISKTYDDNAGTLTLAVNTSTVATLSGTQTFTGSKTFNDNGFTLQDDLDNTKKTVFQLSGLTTATTRTLTVPDVNGTIITTGDTGTVTNTMLAGSIANNKLSNSSITINSSATSLGGSVTLYAGTTTLQTTSANQALTGISSITMPGSSSGTAQITPPAAAGTGTVITLPGSTGTLALNNQTFYIGTQAIAINAGSGTITSLPGLTSVNGTTIPSSATLLTTASTSSALTSFGTSPNINTATGTSLALTGGNLTVRAASTQDGIILAGRSGGTSDWDVTLRPTTLSADRVLTLPDTTGTVITSGDTGTVTSTMIADGTIVNADINASAAIALSKLATDPLARANHTGTQTASTISDFDTQVRTSRLDQMAAPTASVSLNSQKITNLATPTADTDAATKLYVDTAAAGLNAHEAVKYATTGALGTSGNLVGGTITTTYSNGSSGVGATLTIATSSNWTSITIDGQSLTAGDRVLIKNQAANLQNGVYTVTTLGSVGNTTSFVFTRSADMNSTPEFAAGDLVYVVSGTTNGSQLWVQTGTITTVGTSSVTWSQFSGVSDLTAGAGLVKNGNAFDVGAGTGITVNANDVAVDTSVVARKYTTTIGNGSATSIAVTHSLSNQWVNAQVFEVSSGLQVECDVTLTSSSQTTFAFAVAPTTNQYRVVIIG